MSEIQNLKIRDVDTLINAIGEAIAIVRQRAHFIGLNGQINVERKAKILKQTAHELEDKKLNSDEIGLLVKYGASPECLERIFKSLKADEVPFDLTIHNTLGSVFESRARLSKFAAGTLQNNYISLFKDKISAGSRFEEIIARATNFRDSPTR